MARPTLLDGDLWDDDLANASIRPRVALTEGFDEPGFFDPLPDYGLTSAPNNIKPRFYSWYDRLKLTAVGGLEVTYQGCIVGLTNGQIFNLNPGSVFLPNNTTGFVYLSADSPTTASIKAGNVLPFERLLIAVFTTAAGAISNLGDFREQSIALITPQQLPAIASPWLPGDIKLSFRNSLESGWLFCKGQSLAVALYPDLFAAIGYSNGGSGANFLLPNCDDHYFVSSSSKATGEKFGADQVTLSINNMPSHSHATQEEDHLHGFAAIEHSHQIDDPTHGHPHIDRGHNHRTYKDANRTISPISQQTGAEVSAEGKGAAAFTERSDSNITIGNNGTGISLRPSLVLGAVRPGRTNISISANGGNQAFSVIPRTIVGRLMIKL